MCGWGARGGVAEKRHEAVCVWGESNLQQQQVNKIFKFCVRMREGGKGREEVREREKEGEKKEQEGEKLAAVSDDKAKSQTINTAIVCYTS